MSRTIKQIYDESIRERNKRMEIKEFASDSKLSIMNGLTWAFAAVMYSFESLLDVFAVDISNAINNRVNGTPTYYANALLQFQKGDELIVRPDGLAFGYAVVDESKHIVTQVSYVESTDDVNLDSKLILKVATGQKGDLQKIPREDLVLLRSYIDKIKFAGTRIEVTSNEGDVLIPRVTVYYDGAVMESDIYDAIEEQLNGYMLNIEFDSGIYVSKVVEAIRKADHITDVYIDNNAEPQQGIFLACYNSDGNIVAPELIKRMMHTSSGYIRQSAGSGEEFGLPNFRQAIKLIVDRNYEV